MTHQTYRLDIVKHNLPAYTEDSNVRAIILVGSLPSNRATAYSDIDMLLMYDGPIDYDRLAASCERNGGQNRKLMNESDESCLEIYYVGGVECQFSHAPTSFYEEQLKLVLDEHSTEKLPQLVCDGLMHCMVLHGADYVESLRSRLRDYPDELAKKIVQENLRPLPANELRYRIMRNTDMLRYWQIVPKALDYMMKTLLGLNRQYIPGEWKKMDLLCKRLELKPVNLLERMNTALESPQFESLDALDSLWRDTVELIRAHMPDVDLTQADMRLDYAVEPVALPEQ